MNLEIKIKNYWELPLFHQVKYNPWAIELAMNSRGMYESELAGATGLGAKVIEQLIAGEIEATKDQILIIGAILDYPPTFFEQWFESRVEFGPIMGRSIRIDYSKYKILTGRDQPKVIDIVPAGQLKLNL